MSIAREADVTYRVRMRRVSGAAVTVHLFRLQRTYFCPDEFPAAGAAPRHFKTAYMRAMAFVMARRSPGLREELEAKGLDRPIDWRR